MAADEWSPPGVGEPLAGPADAFPDRVADRQPGSTLVAPAGSGLVRLTGGYVAVLRLEGDVEGVVADYAAQLEDFGFEVTPRRRSSRASQCWRPVIRPLVAVNWTQSPSTRRTVEYCSKSRAATTSATRT
jgi:hypothetical protein